MAARLEPSQVMLQTHHQILSPGHHRRPCLYIQFLIYLFWIFWNKTAIGINIGRK